MLRTAAALEFSTGAAAVSVAAGLTDFVSAVCHDSDYMQEQHDKEGVHEFHAGLSRAVIVIVFVDFLCGGGSRSQ